MLELEGKKILGLLKSEDQTMLMAVFEELVINEYDATDDDEDKIDYIVYSLSTPNRPVYSLDMFDLDILADLGVINGEQHYKTKIKELKQEIKDLDAKLAEANRHNGVLTSTVSNLSSDGPWINPFGGPRKSATIKLTEVDDNPF